MIGLLGSILAALWFLLSDLWDVGIMRIVLVITLGFASLLALISGELSVATVCCCCAVVRSM